MGCSPALLKEGRMQPVAEAAPSWDPKPPLLALHPLPSPSPRFQYNFQLTSMSIEQVGRLDCWPITGNHSASQLSPPGRGEGWWWRGSGLLTCRQRRGFRLQAGSLQQLSPPPSHIHPLGRRHRKGWMGRLLRTPAPGPSSPHTELSGSRFFLWGD